jgi:hypothetical protein
MVAIQTNPPITPAQLFDFYERNHICEAAYGRERAAEVLNHPSLTIAAFDGETLVGLVRVLTDGLAAAIMEFSVDLAFQRGTPKHGNGALVESDEAGVGQRLGQTLLAELAARDIDFVSAYIVGDCEEPFYESLGFKPNAGHKVYAIDKRPYASP